MWLVWANHNWASHNLISQSAQRVHQTCYYVSDELNILLIGAGDCRHIMKTMAHCYQYPATKINVGLILLLFTITCKTNCHLLPRVIILYFIRSYLMYVCICIIHSFITHTSGSRVSTPIMCVCLSVHLCFCPQHNNSKTKSSNFGVDNDLGVVVVE